MCSCQFTCLLTCRVEAAVGLASVRTKGQGLGAKFASNPAIIWGLLTKVPWHLKRGLLSLDCENCIDCLIWVWVHLHGARDVESLDQ